MADNLKALEVLKQNHNPATATDTEKVSAVLTILNAAAEARDLTEFGDNPVQNLMTVSILTTTVLDSIEWAIDRPQDKIPLSPEVEGFNPAS